MSKRTAYTLGKHIARCVTEKCLLSGVCKECLQKWEKYKK